MRSLRELIQRFGGLFNKQRKDRELDEEIEGHIQMHMEDNLRLGMTPAEARRQAMIKLGGIESTKEAYRDQRGLPVLETLWQDVRYGVRMFRKNPGFTAVAVLTLAICLGANLTILAVVDAILVRALPFPDSDRLALVYRSYPGAGVDRVPASLPNYFELRGAIKAFESVSIFKESSVIVGGAGEARRVPIMQVSPEFFSTLRAPLALGQSFTEEHLAYGADGVAILTDEFWRGQFNADPSVIGRTFGNDGARVAVIGVLPRGFTFLSSRVQFFRPASHASDDRLPKKRHDGNWNMIARLAPGITLSRAQLQLDALNARLATDDPFPEFAKKGGYRTPVVSLRDDHVRQVKRTLLLLQAAVSVLLVIGVVNLANLLLIRANGKAQEIAVREALGAGRWQIARGVIVEIMALVTGAAVAGLLLSTGGLRLLSTLGAEQLPLGAAIRFDGRIALAGLVITAIVGAVLAALLIGFHFHLKLAPGLKLATRGGTANRGAQRLHHGFVIAQVALAFVLLSGAGLLGVSLKRALETPVGFSVDHLLTGRITFPWIGYTNQPLRVAFVERLLTTVRSLPGVSHAAVTSALPFANIRTVRAISVEGHMSEAASSVRTHHVADVSSDYFRTMGIILLRGRLLEDADRDREPHACVVDQGFAERYWPAIDPIGRRLAGGANFDPEGASVVVGVVANAKQSDIVEDAGLGSVYSPYGLQWPNSFSLIVRSGVPLQTIAPMIRQAIAQCDPGMPIDDLRSMQSRIDDSLVARRSPAVLAGIFAGVALLLASLGTYGVLAYSVSQRQREIGVRMALGAQRTQVLAQFFGLGVKLCLVGIAFGVMGAWANGRAMQSLLYGVGTFPPGIVILTGLTLFAIVSLAILIPSRRAARVDPMVALRYE